MSQNNLEAYSENIPDPKSKEMVSEHTAPEITLSFYTDPTCIWSWAFEPHWIKLYEALAQQVFFQIRMAGLIYPGSAQSKSPYANSNKALDYCRQVAHQTGVQFSPAIWLENEIQSSYPVCIAFHAIVEENFSKQIQFLRKLRQNFFLYGQNNVIKNDFINLLGNMDIDLNKFQKYWETGLAYKEFLINLASHNALGIHSFPTIGLRIGSAAPVFFHGYHHFYKIKTVINRLLPKLNWLPTPGLQFILQHYGPLTEYEIIQLYDLSPDNLETFINDQNFKPIKKEIEGIPLFLYNVPNE